MDSPDPPAHRIACPLIVALAATCLVPAAAVARRARSDGSAAGRKSVAEIVGDAETVRGLVTFHRAPDKLWLEVPASLEGVPLGFAAIRVTGMGDYVMRGGEADSSLVAWRRRGDHLVLSKENTDFRAEPGSQMEETLRATFPSSPVFTGRIEKVGDPAGPLLVDASDLFGDDLARLISPRSGFAVKGSVLVSVAAFPDNVVARVSHRLERKADGDTADADGFARFARPGRLADGRTAEVVVDYNFYRLPDDGFEPRFADERIGGFVRAYKDYSDVDRRDTLFRHLLLRWDLRKQDPSAAVSPPVEPITFIMDRSVPPRWRPLVREAALWWNAAFQEIGFRDAVRVLDPPDDPGWDPAELHQSVIYWNQADDLVFSGAAGPTLADPRTGKVLKANVWLNGEFFSYALNRYLVYAWWRSPTPGVSAIPRLVRREALRALRSDPRSCDRAPSFSSQIAFARLVLQARGVLRPGTGEADRFAREAFAELVAHEVGHALGFPHNWKASLVSRWEDVAAGRVDGSGGQLFSASVMDYNPIYLAPRGMPQGDYFLHRVGPYDELAVEYLYRPLEGSPSERARALDAIAARAEVAPGLAFDSGGTGSIDPTTSSDDLGDDPLAFADSRLAIMREEVLPRLDELVLAEGHDFSLLRQALDSAVFSVAMDYIDIIARHVGGQVLLRRVATSPAAPAGGPPPITPVPAADQRRALGLLEEHVFADGAFALEPDLMARLKADQLRDWNYPWRHQSDYPLGERIAGLHETALATLLSPDRLARILDNERRLGGANDAFTLPELFERLEGAAFGPGAASPSADRRALQRGLLGHLERLCLAPGGTPAEASDLAARSLRSIGRRCESALRDPGRLDAHGVAHFEALRARVRRVLEPRVVLPAPTPG